MKKLLIIVLTFSLIFSLSSTAFASSSSELNLNKFADNFDFKEYYEESGLAQNSELKIINGNTISYNIEWENIDVTCTITEEILEDGTLKKTYKEGEIENVVIFDKATGEISVDGNLIDDEKYINQKIMPRAIPVWQYSQTPFGTPSLYSQEMSSGYKNISYGSTVRTLTLTFIADRIASKCLKYSTLIAISVAGVDIMANTVKKESSPYSKDGKIHETIYCNASDTEARYKHTVKYYDDYDGKYLFTKSFYSRFV